MVAEAAPAVGAGPVAALRQAVGAVVRGKPDAIDMALTALLARGHLLVEDVPGVGKTTLARALARALGGTFRRIQFTSDLLPSDMLGVTVCRRSTTTHCNRQARKTSTVCRCTPGSLRKAACAGLEPPRDIAAHDHHAVGEGRSGHFR